MSSSGDVLCCFAPVLRAAPVAGLSPDGQTVPERVGSGDPGRTVCCRGHRQGAGLQARPTGNQAPVLRRFTHNYWKTGRKKNHFIRKCVGQLLFISYS